MTSPEPLPTRVPVAPSAGPPTPAQTAPPPPPHALSRLEPSQLLLYSALTGVLVGIIGSVFLEGLRLLQAGMGWLWQTAPALPALGGLPFRFEGLWAWVPLLLLPPLFWLLALLHQTSSAASALERTLRAHHGVQAGQELSESPRSSGLRLGGGLLTLGVGVPLGTDGPLALLGHWMGDLSTRVGRLDPLEARTLRLSGVAAGLGLALHAPLAAAVFAVEVLYRRFAFAWESLLCALISSVVAYSVFGLFLGFGPPLILELPPALPALALPLCLLLGGLCAALVSVFSEALSWVRAGWARLERARLVLAPLMGLLLGGLLLAVPALQGDGLGWFQLELSGLISPTESWGTLLFRGLALLLLAGLGIPGGLLIPSLVLGGGLGNALGGLLSGVLPGLLPGLDLDHTPWGLIGACAWLSAAFKTPLAGVLLGLSWGGESLLPGLLLGCGAAFALSSERGLLTAQAETRPEETEPRDDALEPPALEAVGAASGPEAPEGRLFRLPLPPALLGQGFQDSLFRPQATVVAVLRGGEALTPTAGLVYHPGDELVLVATREQYALLQTRLAELETLSQ